jgi:hypothetical protein
MIEVKSLKETTLIRKLKKLKDAQSLAVYKNLDTLCDEASQRIKLLPKYMPQYTLHDEVHSFRVIEIMGKILGNTLNELNSLEIILLILSAYYHDQGMVPEKDEVETLETDEKFCLYRDNWYIEHPNYKDLVNKLKKDSSSEIEKNRLNKLLADLDTAMYTEYFRQTHGERSKRFVINKLATDPRFSVNEINISNLLGNLCVSHCISVQEIIDSNEMETDKLISNYSVNMKYLAVILRLADIMDFDKDRTPDVLFNSINITSEISIAEWEKHRGVMGWEIASERIRYSCEYTHPVYEATARKYMDVIDKELHECHSMCAKFPQKESHYKLEIPQRVDRSSIKPKNNSYIFNELEFKLSRNEIVNLLMTDKLYSDPSLCIRELLQNSLDALRLRKSLFKCDGAEWNKGEVRFKHYQNEEGYHVLECKDNGVGMDENIVTNYLVKIGKSFYRSPEYEKMRIMFRENETDFDPCSRFGIGFMSCFMLGDKIVIETRKGLGTSNPGKPLVIEINGINSLLVIKEGDRNQEIGTTIKIITRYKDRIIDFFDDKIKLCYTLQAYALAVEYPIYADCLVDSISKSISIKYDLEVPLSQFEKKGLNNIKNVELATSEIGAEIHGKIKQSFLIDDSEEFTLENDEAKIIPDNSGRETTWKIEIKRDKGNGHIWSDDMLSICVDGILVSGKYGKNDFKPHSWKSAVVNCGEAMILDIRGNAKPELLPNRIPDVEEFRYRLENRPGWKKIQNIIYELSGKLWGQILESLGRKKNYELFWKLVSIYRVNINWIAFDKIINYLALPMNVENKIEFIKLCDIEKYRIDYLNNEYIISYGDASITFDKMEIKFGNQYVLKTLLFVSVIKFVNGKSWEFVLDKNRNRNDNSPLNYNRIIRAGYTSCYLLDFICDDKKALALQTSISIANKLHPLCQLLISVDDNSDIIYKFAERFIIGITDILSNEYIFKEKLEYNRWKKSIGTMYFDIDFTSSKLIYRAPYKLWKENEGWIEITEDTFKKWKDIIINSQEEW